MSGAIIIAFIVILFAALAIALIGSLFFFPVSAGVARREAAGGGLYLHAGAAVRSKGGDQ